MLTAARALTTPLRPDDYIELMNPMWTTRELRGEIVEVRPETDDAATVVVRPSSRWLARPGTYSIERARGLGYAPAVGLDEGMSRTEDWLREHGLLRGGGGKPILQRMRG